MSQTVKGWQFPDGVTVPEDTWSKASAGGEEFWVFGWEGYVDIAKQCGLTEVDTRIDSYGKDDGVSWVAARARVTIDGDRYSAIGSTDATSNSLEDMASTAQSRALKRAIRVALGIRRVGNEDSEPEAPPEFDPDDGHAMNTDSDGDW